MFHLLQVSSLIVELASVAAAERGLSFDEGMEERLCAYSIAVAHFPTCVKEAIPNAASLCNVMEWNGTCTCTTLSSNM